MSFSDDEIAQILKWMGVSKRDQNTVTAYNPFYDAITEAGEDPPSAAIIRAALADLEEIEQGMKALRIQFQVASAGADEISLRPAKGMFLWKQEGRRVVGILSDAIGLAPARDVFSGTKTAPVYGDW